MGFTKTHCKRDVTLTEYVCMKRITKLVFICFCIHCYDERHGCSSVYGNDQREGTRYPVVRLVYCRELERDKETPAEHEQCDCVQGGITEFGPEMLLVIRKVLLLNPTAFKQGWLIRLTRGCVITPHRCQSQIQKKPLIG